MSDSVKVGLLGRGTVGGAFVELIERQADSVAAVTGRRPELVDVLTRSSGNFDAILESSEVIVELMGGVDDALAYVKKALQAGRHVITANKQMISRHGEELFELARDNDVHLRFEAAIAGVIPAVRVIDEALAGAEIEKVHGIVNGTTNFILTEMARTGESYADALGRAQQLGYAEADPADDVSGGDAAAKMAILARLAFGVAVSVDQVDHEGIEALTTDDIEYAREFDLVLKLVGSAERTTDGLSVRVFPAFLYPGHPLASVNGPFNAVTVESPAITEITMSGPGAGGSQTASAVLGDLVTVISRPPVHRPPAKPAQMISDVESAFYLHLEVEDLPGVLASVAERLGDRGVSVRSVVQRGMNGQARLVMVVHPSLESSFFAAVDEIAKLDFMRATPRAIRVIHEEFG